MITLPVRLASNYWGIKGMNDATVVAIDDKTQKINVNVLNCWMITEERKK